MQALLQEWLSVWKQDSSSAPAFDSAFTPQVQATRETCLDLFLQSVEKELRDRPNTRSERSAAQKRITSAFTTFAKTGLDLGDPHLELLLDHGFSSVATQLAREARHLDRAISAADIFQACRNAWTACALQSLMGKPMRLTPSIFAYSMLYPYTDNYLDDPSTSLAAKLAFSGRFRQRLEGHAVAPLNEREASIWRLVELIEEEYPRTDWPEVYIRLLAIHEAQEKSVRMLRFGSSPDNVDVLKLSFEKGGTSVVADACLVAGSLSPEEAQVAFGWGVLLQLEDDLQDLQQDLREGSRTIFTQAVVDARSGPSGGASLDDLTTRMLQFGGRVIRLIERMPADRSALHGAALNHKPLKEMIRMSCSLLPVWSAGDSARHFTRAYLAQLESHSPFRFAALGDRRKKLAHWTAPLTRMFESFLEEEQDAAAPLLLANFLMPRSALS
ncbi:MAG TPA: hypothetical protein VEI54_08385 [Candidatus Limnocylindrales bacterium]|nr:hypothetical protein [Candidatus Limnocylindrales bacterium]